MVLLVLFAVGAFVVLFFVPVITIGAIALISLLVLLVKIEGVRRMSRENQRLYLPALAGYASF